MSEHYDIVVIGSGPGGYRAAVLAALRGQRVAIVERQDWGGCCLNRGCVPKKTWHHTANLIAASRRYADRGLDGVLQPDLPRAWRHQEQVVATVQRSYLDYMHRLGIKTVAGTARFADAHTVQVAGADGEARLAAGHVIIATGSVPHLPEGMETVPGRILTTDMLFDAPPPAGWRVAVVGAGVIGTEFAYILAMLGREVNWLTSRAPLSRHLFSAQALSTLREACKACGIVPREGARMRGARIEGDQVVVHLGDGATVTVDWLLLGTGRRPYTEGLGLEAAGIDLDADGFVATNARLQTSAPSVYAIGDCVSAHMTANQAMADATLAVGNIIDGSRGERDPLWVPEVVYSAVELARIGMNEDLAEDAELEPAVGFAAFETSPAALGQDQTRGFVRILGDMDQGRLLGGEVVGRDAGELIHLLSLAPDHNTALKWLAQGRFNHPARAEEFINATETLAMKWGLADTVFAP